MLNERKEFSYTTNLKLKIKIIKKSIDTNN